MSLRRTDLRATDEGYPIAIDHDGRVNQFLVGYLLTVDDELLRYLDPNGEMDLDAVRLLRYYTTALLDGSVSPIDIVKNWPDWYLLAPAFVAAYVPEDVEVLEKKAGFLAAAESGRDVTLTGVDRTYLTALRLHLNMYPEMLAI
jgi:hypothetical protein